MKKFILISLMGLNGFVGLMGQCLPTTRQGTEQVRIVRVIDGDTIEVRDIWGNTWDVRLLGINAPEITRGNSEPFGQEAKEFVEGLILGRDVWLINDRPKNEYTFNRRLVFVEIDGRDVSLALVESGLAQVYEDKYRTSRTEEYAKAQTQARTSRIGIWGATNKILV